MRVRRFIVNGEGWVPTAGDCTRVTVLTVCWIVQPATHWCVIVSEVHTTLMSMLLLHAVSTRRPATNVASISTPTLACGHSTNCSSVFCCRVKVVCTLRRLSTRHWSSHLCLAGWITETQLCLGFWPLACAVTCSRYSTLQLLPSLNFGAWTTQLKCWPVFTGCMPLRASSSSCRHWRIHSHCMALRFSTSLMTFSVLPTGNGWGLWVYCSWKCREHAFALWLSVTELSLWQDLACGTVCRTVSPTFKLSKLSADTRKLIHFLFSLSFPGH